MRRAWMMVAFAAALLVSCTRETTVPETVYTLKATFEQGAPTRSSLVMNGEGTEASVVWTAGDSFYMYGGNYRAQYTTSEGGAEAEFTTKYQVGTPCYSIYPASRVHGRGSLGGETVLVAKIPGTQTAVAGGIEDGLNISVAYSETQTTDLKFRNILSYIRFRVDGAAVGALKEVVFDAGTTVAGTVTIQDIASDPNPNFNTTWSGETVLRSTQIALTGDFEAGKDYFLAFCPVHVQGFNLLFHDADGKTIRKHSTLEMTFERSRIYDFGTIALGDSFPTEDTGEGVVQYMTATQGTCPVTVCVISEGFTTAELPDFVQRAESAVDYLFATEPFKTYRDYFNVYFLKVPSAESGASVTDGSGNITTSRDSYFKARWGENRYDDMTADGTIVYQYVSAHCPDILSGIHTIQEVPILMLINDNRYGGICHFLSDGRGYGMVPFTDAGGQLMWSYPNLQMDSDVSPELNYHQTTDEELQEMGRCYGDWRNIVIHEFGGHCFSRLADEYWHNTYLREPMAVYGQDWQVPIALNVSDTYEHPRWQEDLLDRQSELVARDPHYGRIGIYQGGDTYLNYRWRSEKISCMIDNRPYFSAWQRILIVRRIMSLAGETFSLEDFLATDVTTDPIRDGGGPSAVYSPLARPDARLVPLLPPPVADELD